MRQLALPPVAPNSAAIVGGIGAGDNVHADFGPGSGRAGRSGFRSLRPAGWTSADAAGLPILPGLARYQDVAKGRIDHALRFTVEDTRRSVPGSAFEVVDGTKLRP
ncbi:MAG: hypothetical protein ACYC1P_10215 [Gaiellaceae bacterium]